MPDKTPIVNGWGVAPGGQVSHLIRAGRPVCDSVQSDKWLKPSYAFSKHCHICERQADE